MIFKGQINKNCHKSGGLKRRKSENSSSFTNFIVTITNIDTGTIHINGGQTFCCRLRAFCSRPPRGKWGSDPTKALRKMPEDNTIKPQPKIRTGSGDVPSQSANGITSIIKLRLADNNQGRPPQGITPSSVSKKSVRSTSRLDNDLVASRLRTSQ